MKYMGHKGKLLPVLGEILKTESASSSAIADPFCGSAAVSWYLAQNTEKKVVSGDLQTFATCRAAAIIQRTQSIDFNSTMKTWWKRSQKIVEDIVERFPNSARSLEPDQQSTEDIIGLVIRSRIFCDTVLPAILAGNKHQFPMTKAYGGYYFSPLQAITLDALRSTLPRESNARAIALASLIETASKCAAAPGHTAQPFQPTETSAKYIFEAWQRPIFKILSEAAKSISKRHAKTAGETIIGDFNKTLSTLNSEDLVFADPPYSGVHYSRFYHVLETLAKGKEISVSGRGRYPDISQRPSSLFSQKSQAMAAAKSLVEGCHQKRLNLVLTFPSEGSSNGLSASDFIDIGRNLFSSIKQHEIDSDFSTLGGNKIIRSARLKCKESIVCFRI
ncbi:DNA adenine methylase [Pseudomonas aeruginosa]|uniref:DNA adenine methylase n=1 Tax=Pseudomonas aeruginosa TaxID=287 RepID=UPI002F424075